jgi:hypothetical protein
MTSFFREIKVCYRLTAEPVREVPGLHKENQTGRVEWIKNKNIMISIAGLALLNQLFFSPSPKMHS